MNVTKCSRTQTDPRLNGCVMRVCPVFSLHGPTPRPCSRVKHQLLVESCGQPGPSLHAAHLEPINSFVLSDATSQVFLTGLGVLRICTEARRTDPGQLHETDTAEVDSTGCIDDGHGKSINSVMYSLKSIAPATVSIRGM